MARPNPDWPGNAALGAESESGEAPVVATLAPAPGGPVRVGLNGAAGQIVLSLLVTGDTPGPCMPETAALIVRLNSGADAEAALSLPLARCLRGLLVRTAVPPEVEDDAAALIASLQNQLAGATHG